MTDRDRALRMLRSMFIRRRSPDALTVYVKTDKVSRSGMSRTLSCYVVRDGRIRDITWHVALVIGCSFDRDSHTFRISGCGMDMHFAAVYELSMAIFSDGYRIRHESL